MTDSGNSFDEMALEIQVDSLCFEDLAFGIIFFELK
jgi:hypothetical protein